MAEAQAVDRVHRIGQSREVFTTRYITHDSIETVSLAEPVTLARMYADRQQYVQWIQKQKLRLIDQTLDTVNVSQTEIDDQRWKVGNLPFNHLQHIRLIRSAEITIVH